MLDWFAHSTDLIALFIAVLGLMVSLITVLFSVRHSRLEAYTRMHELLVSPEVARGRRILFQTHAAHALPKPNEEGWDEINRSMAMYDTLGVYVRRHIVSERLVLGSWFHALCAIHDAADAWLAHRHATGHRNPWPSLTYLLDRAERYHSRQGCCTDTAMETIAVMPPVAETET